MAALKLGMESGTYEVDSGCIGGKGHVPAHWELAARVCKFCRTNFFEREAEADKG